MSWTWVWIGGPLVLGFHLGATLMSLLVMSRDSQSDDDWLRPGQRARACRTGAGQSPRLDRPSGLAASQRRLA